MFNTMLEGIKEETIGYLFNAEVRVQPAGAGQAGPGGQLGGVGQAPIDLRARGLRGAAPSPATLQYSAPTIDGAAGTGAVQVQSEQDRTAAPALGLGAGERPSSGTSARSGTGRDGSGTGPAGNRPASGRRQQAPGQVVGSGPSRNAPCPCGSGKKYKRCHGAPSAAE